MTTASRSDAWQASASLLKQSEIDEYLIYKFGYVENDKYNNIEIIMVDKNGFKVIIKNGDGLQAFS